MKHIMLAYNSKQAGGYEFADFQNCCVFRMQSKIVPDVMEGSIATIYQAGEQRIIGEFEVVRIEYIDEPSTSESEKLYRQAFGEPVTLYDGEYYGPIHIFYRSVKLYSPEIDFERFRKFRDQRGMSSKHPITFLNLDETDIEFIHSLTRKTPLASDTRNEELKESTQVLDEFQDSPVIKHWLNDRVSDLIVFMKVGKYGSEILPNIMRRINAEYQYERHENGNKEAFYPYGYQVFNDSGYTSDRLRKLIGSQRARLSDSQQDVIVVFSPNVADWPAWDICRKTGGFNRKYRLKTPQNPWRYITPPVNGVEILPEHYSVSGEDLEYYGLVFQDLELYTDAGKDYCINLSNYRRLYDEGDWKNGSELTGKQWQSCPIPCYRVEESAQTKRVERVIGIARLIDPYSVKIGYEPFQH